MNDNTIQRNIATTGQLLEDAMPQGHFEVIRSLVTPDAPIRRAGFADLYALTGAAIPQSGNYVEWDEMGVLHFNDEGKITELWFMCQELSLAAQIGCKMQLI